MKLNFDNKAVKEFFKETCKLGGNKKEIDTQLERNKLANYLANNKDNMSENDIDTSVGKRIEIRRKLMKMTQRDLACKIGVTFQQLQKYEQGANRVSASRLWLISRALNTDINFFFADIPSKGFDEKDIMLQQKSLELLMAYSKIKNAKIADIVFNLMQEMVR